MSRDYRRKRVPILSGDGTETGDYVDIPVIYEMTIKGSRGQDYRYRFQNSSVGKGRTVVVSKVGATTGSFEDESTVTDKSSFVNAERTRTIPFTSALDELQPWETDKKLKNLDPAPKQPDGSDDPRHKEVHYVRFYKNNDLTGSTWMTTEMIDQVTLKGSRGQDFGFKLKHPTAGEYADLGGDGFGVVVTDDDPYKPIVGWVDLSAPLLPVEYDDDGKPLATKTDPWQNIVNVSGGTYLMITFGWQDGAYGPIPETCYAIFPDETVLDPGVECSVNTVNIDIQWVEGENSPFTLLNPENSDGDDPELVTEDFMFPGYEKYGPCETPCSGFNFPTTVGNPQGCPPSQERQEDTIVTRYFSDGVPGKFYGKTFLFSCAPSLAGSQTPNIAKFTISGVPGVIPFVKDLGVNPQGFPKGQTFLAGSSLTMNIRVFDSTKIQVYRHDESVPEVPLRKKNEQFPDDYDIGGVGDEAGTAPLRALSLAKMSSNKDSIGGYVNPSPNEFHEAWEGTTAIEIPFETYVLSDNQQHAIGWPKVPASRQSSGLPTGDVVLLTYTYFGGQPDFIRPTPGTHGIQYIKFGDPPNTPPNATGDGRDPSTLPD